MAGAHDDVQRYGEGLAAWLRHRGAHSGPEVVAMTRPGAGYASNSWLVTLRGDQGPSLLLRLPPEHDTHLGDKLELQVLVQNALHQAGVPVAAPATYEPDPSWLGAPFLTMPCIAGHVGGEVPALDPWITGSTREQQRHLYDNFTDTLADLHRVEVLQRVRAALPGRDDDLSGDIGWWEAYLDWATESSPPSLLVEALVWCRRTQPPDPRRGLVWGDPRIGNAIFGDQFEVRALIDWETARIGPAEYDVGWWLGLEAIAADLLDARPPGFALPQDAVARYERRLGRALQDLDWFTTFAIVTASCIAVRLDVLRRGPAAGLVAAERNPMFDVVRRRIRP